MNERDENMRDPALSQLYRQSAAGEPPAALDAAILAAARQAVQTPAPRPQPWWKRLRTPMAVAATVMLAVMLSLTVDRQPRDLPPPPVLDEQAPAPVERRQATLPAAAPAPKPEMKADQPAVKAKRAEPAPMPEQAAASANRQPPAPMEKKESAAARPMAPEVEMRDALRAPPVGAASGMAVPAPAAAPAAMPQSAEEAPRRELQKSAAPALRAAKPAPLTPEAWVEEIRNLRRQGRFEEATKRLAELRQSYPDYPLPEDLR